MHHHSKLEDANVVAWFDSQYDADEAVLGLRIAGFPDRRIGYYYPTTNGVMADLLTRYHRFAAIVLGTILGGALGAWCGWLLAQWGYAPGESPDPIGLAVTCGICGALFLGTVGGMTGLWTERPGTYADAPDAPTEPYVIAVDAGDARDRAMAIIRHHGGYEIQPHTAPMPAAHPM